jgi:hypothetical protein
MGDHMTDQTPIISGTALRIGGDMAGAAPPLAPMAMPKQVLTPMHGPVRGPVRRAFARMIAGLGLVRNGFRRIG